ncbi:MAG: CDP-diacylglycerol--glycerol-3-phosphate 3-phosphatidyltransferase [Fibrobacteres bacterium]|nr:CDP-diacylglycerol--glycerol-3-phosphate 3-phosphatidyltransferase [Fibrobacterota bacterium]
MTDSASPRPRPKWFAWVQTALFALWIPVLILIPFHGDYEAVALLGVLFFGGGFLGWIDRRWREEEKLQIWAGSFERVFLLVAVWFLAQRLWGDEWEPFPTLLTIMAGGLFLRYLVGFVLILARERSRLPPVRRDVWQYFAHWSVYAATLLQTLEIQPYATVACGISIILCIVGSGVWLIKHFRHPEARSHMTVATQITLSRIVLAPVFIAVFFYDGDSDFTNNHLVFQVLALLIAISSAISDWLDGHLARKWGEVTTLGKYLDPWSDKIATFTTFLCFLGTGWASVAAVAIIFYRESAVETLRTLAAGEGEVIAARKSGKWKTAIQIGAIIAILTFAAFDGILRDLHLDWPWWTLAFKITPPLLMWLVAAVTAASGLEYLYASRKILSKHL